MRPMKLKPVYDKTIWTDNCLTTMHSVEEKGLDTCWKISVHPHAKNVILSREYAGRTLDELTQADPQSMLEKEQLHQMLCFAYPDAREDLSIQVHSYDEYARVRENGEGKTESWYILEADKGATLMTGAVALDIAMIKVAVENDQVEDYVRKVEVEADDFVCIDAGILHALGKDTLVLEIGQNSNTTYRFYDHHRQDVNGKERELHIDKSFDVADFELYCSKVASPFTDADTTQEKLLVDRWGFSVRLVGVVGSCVLPQDEKRFYCLNNVSTDCILRYQGEELLFTSTENTFIPVGCADIEICGKACILVSSVG